MPRANSNRNRLSGHRTEPHFCADRGQPNSFRSGVLSLLFLTVALALDATAGKPNIVFLLADDLGVGSVNCYHAATNLVRTPNMDRLAREGRRFTDANTPSSVCSPTRYAVLTPAITSQMTVTEITYGVGFSDLKHFRSVFREQFGVLPGDYSKRSSGGFVS